MRIVADENIAGLREYFSSHGEVISLPGRSISASHLVDADALLVRSVTQVNARLLQASSVRFVGSCTIGVDHLDTQWLAQRGIACAHAPGCNARAVVDYVLCSLSALKVDLSRAIVGIVGCGNVGGLLDVQLRSLGVSTLCCDPFLKETSARTYVDLQELLSQSDAVCLHTPLTRDGLHPTYHLLDEKKLQLLKQDVVLLNAGRGAVIESRALLKILRQRPGMRTVLDVWENEPHIDAELVERATLATPHIAGYSLAGKWRGTHMVHSAFCQFFSLSLPPAPRMPEGMFADWPRNLAVEDPRFGTHLLTVYDPREDSRCFKASVSLDKEARAEKFDRLRKEYPWRAEFGNHL